MKCRQCGKELKPHWSTDICLEYSRENMKKIFRENPEVKQAFRETIEELKKPENIEKMAKNTANFMNTVQALRVINNGHFNIRLMYRNRYDLLHRRNGL